MRLKNGTEEATVVVQTTWLSLKRLMDEGNPALYELVMLCRDPSYRASPPGKEKLLALGLVKEGNGNLHVHGSTKNVVLSAAEGDGLELTFGNPRAQEQS